MVILKLFIMFFTWNTIVANHLEVKETSFEKIIENFNSINLTLLRRLF